MRVSIHSLAISWLLLLCPASSAEPAEIAAANAKRASEALRQAHRVTHAWLKRQDRVTGLLPRNGQDPNWVVKDSAADLYPFMVLAARFTDPVMFETEMRRILQQEVLLTTRVGRLSDDLLPGGKGFAFPEADLERIIFGSSEYAKDGLLPITELLGDSAWYHRLVGIAQDIARNAPYKTARGRLPARTAEVNGNMLQVFSRLAWKTGQREFMDQAIAIADYYFLDMLPSTNYIPADLWDTETRKPLRPVFVLSDHGNEIVGGLSEIYVLLRERQPEKARQYREPFTRMIDRLLESGRNSDGVWVSRLDLETGKVIDARHAHCWGYMFNAVCTAWLATGDEKYRRAVEQAMDGVTRNPKYLFDETGAGRNWKANAYSDSIEGALVLLNRLPHAGLARALDEAAAKFLASPQPNGIVEDWHGDGNFIRTALMYAFWKTQGAYLAPWDPRVHLGAVRKADELQISLSAETSWQGRVRFDHPRHRDHWNMTSNYPRLNEFPEWYTVEHDRAYGVRIGGRPLRTYIGADLVSGILVTIEAGETIEIRISESGKQP